MNLAASPVQRVTFRGRDWWIKRDDLLQPLSGNKARKLAYWLTQDWSEMAQILSWGGAQSNAMLALARLAQWKKVPLHYYCRPLPAWLRRQPIGNLRAALACGMILHEIPALEPESLRQNAPESSLVIPQGGAMPQAEWGVRVLAEELLDFAATQNWAHWCVALAAGTGATALYLQKHLPVPVYCVPCVGDAAYLLAQFAALEPEPARYPSILAPAVSAAFGSPRKEFLSLWQILHEETGIEFDLLYDPPTWLSLLQQPPEIPCIYLHCGGAEGNASMLARYRYARNTQSE